MTSWMAVLCACAPTGSTGASSSSGGSSTSSTMAASSTMEASSSVEELRSSSSVSLVSSQMGATSAPASSTSMAGTSASSGQQGVELGGTCVVDGDCASGMCRDVGWLPANICVAACSEHSGCVGMAGFSCQPDAPGSQSGYCLPLSPVHCKTCSTTSDCGVLAEVCTTAGSDTANACHVDCSLAGQNACPSDYACQDVMVDNVARKLCMPSVADTCPDALGGACDRVGAPQACRREDVEGTCGGYRICHEASHRYRPCDADKPACKTSCSQPDPGGCQLTTCPGIANAPDACGTCDTVCPGLEKTRTNVTCRAASQCTFSCQGAAFDVDNNPANGCEWEDASPGNHSQAAAAFLGNVDCGDNPDTGMAGVTLQARGLDMFSDQRVHENPGLSGLSATTGAAPDYFTIHATGGLCFNNVGLHLGITGSQHPSCYKLTVTTTTMTFSCLTTAAEGGCSIVAGSGSYDSGTDVLVKVEKTCPAAQRDAAVYSITGHL